MTGYTAILQALLVVLFAPIGVMAVSAGGLLPILEKIVLAKRAEVVAFVHGFGVPKENAQIIVAVDSKRRRAKKA